MISFWLYIYSSHELELKPTFNLSNLPHQDVPEYEAIPVLGEPVDNPVAEPNITYGKIDFRSGQNR